MANNEEDIKLEKISKFLEQGGTMLAQHCECGVPLFRFKGKVICPICDSNSNKDEKKQIPSANEIPRTSIVTPSTPSNIQFSTSTGIQSDIMSSETSEFIKKTLINKIVQLSLDLQRETDLSRIKQQIEAIESGTKALNNLK